MTKTIRIKPSRPAVERLSLYRDTVRRFRSYGTEWIQSDEIAGALGVKPAQVRKDLSMLGITGRRKAGYDAAFLQKKADEILGVKTTRNAVIAGLGPLGISLIKENVFARQNIRIVAVFEDKERYNESSPQVSDVDVYQFPEMVDIVKQHSVRFGVITCGAERAQQMADMMIMSGIEGILSLAPVELRAPGYCVVNTVNFAHELERVIYFTDNNPRKRKITTK